MNLLRGFVLCAVVLAASLRPAVADRLNDPAISETSGIAASQHHPTRFWAINDSGHAALLFLLDSTGTLLSRVAVNGVRNRDWEDLDSFTLDGKAYLLIADVGDNSASRPVSQLIFVEEPDDQHSGGINPVLVLNFRYQDGPQDCEAVAVDVAGRQILLVGKHSAPPPIYSLALDLGASPGVRTATRVATVTGLPSPTPAEILGGPLGLWRHQPTGLAISSDQTLMALVTYQAVYLYRRPATSDWVAALQSQPEPVRLRLAQTEAVTFFDGSLLLIPEGRFAPLLRVSLP